MSPPSHIPFSVKTDRILEILSKQIYDSPYAMARENIQNAYDAVLMRANREHRELTAFPIHITASADRLMISDSGIGMSERVLRDNFWQAGSSGKNTSDAKAAGVIGTFGIGAMANFGVCHQLTVETREPGSEAGIRTSARKSELQFGENCVQLEVIAGIADGTTLTADIEPTSNMDVVSLRNYLVPFVRFLKVPVFVNGELLSGQDPAATIGISDSWKELGRRHTNVGRFAFRTRVWADGSQLAVTVDEMLLDGVSTTAAMWLRPQSGQVMGLRSRFGLAPIPISGVYQLGGFADLPFLMPTAGREALTRESIQEASQLIGPIETAISEVLKDTELADSHQGFQQYVLQLGTTAWAARVTVQVQPRDEKVELGELASRYKGRQLQWYAGSDAETIRTFSSEDSPLVRVSQGNPRRELQQRYITQILALPAIPDAASILERFGPENLTRDELSLTFAVGRTLRTDYLFENVEINWVRISHGVPMLAAMDGEKLTVSLSRSWSALQTILKVMEASPEVIDGLAKDFVRVHVYPHIHSFVPSSQRTGLEALQKTLERRRELYRLEPDDRGELEPLLADYLTGKIDLGQVLTAATHVTSGQTQHVRKENVGTVEMVLADVVNAPVRAEETPNLGAPAPGSPILRPDSTIHEKLLITQRELPQLNNYKLFLALSDRLFLREREFFLWPHSTQVAWAGRRIVFLFSLANSDQSLYYDVELRGDRIAGDAGGTALVTTTIVASNRIFVPVPQQLAKCFEISGSSIEFYVRFDVLLHQ
jgi:molecular chaperone HtpG